MDTENKFMVASQGGQIVMLAPVTRMSKADALNLAAWLVVLADERDEFPGGRKRWRKRLSPTFCDPPQLKPFERAQNGKSCEA